MKRGAWKRASDPGDRTMSYLVFYPAAVFTMMAGAVMLMSIA